MAEQGFKVSGSISAEGSQFVNVTTISAATYDLLVTDYILNVAYTGTGEVTSLTLPTAQVEAGRIIKIVDTGGNASTNNITIDTEGSETINGEATYVIDVDYGVVELYCDGTNWFSSGAAQQSSASANGIALIDSNGTVGSLTLTNGDAIPVFQDEVYSNTSNVSINSTTQIILSAGKTYKLIADMSLGFSGISSAQYTFYNVTGTAAIGSEGASLTSTYTATHGDNDCEAVAIIDVSVNTTIELRVVSTSNNITSVLTGSKVVVEELD